MTVFSSAIASALSPAVVPESDNEQIIWGRGVVDYEAETVHQGPVGDGQHIPKELCFLWVAP
jgi:hypothetical protein